MPRRILIAEDVRAAAPGSEIVLPPDAVVTERAREVAGERGVQIRIQDSGVRIQDSGVGSQDKDADTRQRSVAIASDHGGFELKEYLKRFLTDVGYAVDDLGTHSADPVDYPDFAAAVAQKVAAGEAWRGMVVDAAGIGSAMAANKVPGARAALCYDRATARNSREHNDANVLTLGARLLRPEEAREIAAVWLETKFGGGRHQRRVDKIVALEHGDGATYISGLAKADSSSPPAPQNDSVRDTVAVPGANADSRCQLVEAITKEVLCYLGDKQMCELRGLEIDEVVCPGCDGRCVEQCARKAGQVVAAGAERLTAGPGISGIPAEVARLIDHTLLKPEASEEQIRKLCAEAREFGFATVCVNPAWVAVGAAALAGSAVKVCTVVGFPLGATLAPVKIFEAEQAVKLGAQEIDMVINVGALKSAQYERVEQDIRGVAAASHAGGAILKVILECALLTDQEKVIACRLAQSAGADFVKTSTGFGPGGATARDVELMRLVVGPHMGVKAAGGIRSYEDLQKMITAGATRIGASASVKILQEASSQEPPNVRTAVTGVRAQ